MRQGCRRSLKEGQWWAFCGETDMGQTSPALCTECGGTFILKDDDLESDTYISGSERPDASKKVLP